MADREQLSTSFGAAAGAYEAGRPDYPSAAVEWMLQPAVSGAVPGAASGSVSAGARLRVVDVGAGTGKLTRVIVRTGAETVAVDPDADMLTALQGHVLGVPTFVGTAERLPLPDASVDAVLLGQAWHWVDVDAASAEIARVLRPGGALGLVWNIRDEAVPWVAELTRIMHGSHAEEMLGAGGVRVAAPFGVRETQTWRWTRTLTRPVLRDMVASRSYVITAPQAVRDSILMRVDDLFSARCRIGDDGVEVVDLPYRTEAFRTVRP